MTKTIFYYSLLFVLFIIKAGPFVVGIQTQCLHVSARNMAPVAMSKFDPGQMLPYERLTKNLAVIRKRYLIFFTLFYDVQLLVLYFSHNP